MNNQDEKTVATLLSLGLSEKEASVYLSALEAGRGTVSLISRKAGINRTTGYTVLGSLASKGLVSISGKEPKQEYVAESPNNLVTFLEKRVQGIERSVDTEKKKIETAENLLPQLKSVHKVGDRPQVRFYDGTDGLKHVYNDTLAAAGEDGIRSFGSYEDMANSLGPEYGGYIKKRSAKRIFGRGIYPRTPVSIERQKRDAEEYRELVLFPEEKPSAYPEIDIYGDKVMIASAKEKLGIIIESKEIAAAMKKFFDIAWERGKQLEANSASD